jgi:hypothetical protein
MASLTFTARPFSSFPFKALMAARASASLDISTNPKPLDLPLKESLTMVAVSTWP